MKAAHSQPDVIQTGMASFAHISASDTAALHDIGLMYMRKHDKMLLASTAIHCQASSLWQNTLNIECNLDKLIAMQQKTRKLFASSTSSVEKQSTAVASALQTLLTCNERNQQFATELSSLREQAVAYLPVVKMKKSVAESRQKVFYVSQKKKHEEQERYENARSAYEAKTQIVIEETRGCLSQANSIATNIVELLSEVTKLKGFAAKLAKATQESEVEVKADDALAKDTSRTTQEGSANRVSKVASDTKTKTIKKKKKATKKKKKKRMRSRRSKSPSGPDIEELPAICLLLYVKCQKKRMSLDRKDFREKLGKKMLESTSPESASFMSRRVENRKRDADMWEKFMQTWQPQSENTSETLSTCTAQLRRSGIVDEDEHYFLQHGTELDENEGLLSRCNAQLKATKAKVLAFLKQWFHKIVFARNEIVSGCMTEYVALQGFSRSLASADSEMQKSMQTYQKSADDLSMAEERLAGLQEQIRSTEILITKSSSIVARLGSHKLLWNKKYEKLKAVLHNSSGDAIMNAVLHIYGPSFSLDQRKVLFDAVQDTLRGEEYSISVSELQEFQLRGPFLDIVQTLYPENGKLQLGHALSLSSALENFKKSPLLIVDRTGWGRQWWNYILQACATSISGLQEAVVTFTSELPGPDSLL